jgi:hypothetical protein
MTTLTIEQLKKLEFEFNIFEADTMFERSEVDRSEDWAPEEMHPYYISYVVGSCTATADKIKIEFFWTAQGGSKSIEDAYEFDISIEDDQDIKIEGLEIVDEDGDKIEGLKLDHVVIEAFNALNWEHQLWDKLPTINDN